MGLLFVTVVKEHVGRSPLPLCVLRRKRYTADVERKGRTGTWVTRNKTDESVVNLEEVD